MTVFGAAGDLRALPHHLCDSTVAGLCVGPQQRRAARTLRQEGQVGICGWLEQLVAANWCLSSGGCNLSRRCRRYQAAVSSGVAVAYVQVVYC
jgi:hypothetical protein